MGIKFGGGNVGSGTVKIMGGGAGGSGGSQGPQGDTGAPGPQGNPGVSGSQGAQGEAGSQGSQGSMGPQGNQGSQGSTGSGSQGAQGAQGPQGNQGSTGSGSQGAQGSQGNQGAQGATGPQGGNASVAPTTTFGVASTSALGVSSEYCASTTYVNIPYGNSITLTTGTDVLVSYSVLLTKGDAGANGVVAYVDLGVSGASTIAASDATAAMAHMYPQWNNGVYTRTYRLSGLTAGSNTFQLKWRVSALPPTATGRAQCMYANLSIIPL